MNGTGRRFGGRVRLGAAMVGQVAVLLALSFALRGAAAWTERRLGAAEAQAAWETWRREAVERGREAGVARRPPQSAEPPLRVLLRDHFPVCLAATLVLGSTLYWLLLGLLVGAARSGSAPAAGGP